MFLSKLRIYGRSEYILMPRTSIVPVYTVYINRWIIRSFDSEFYANLYARYNYNLIEDFI